MRYKYLLLLFSSLLFFSCEMKKEILGQTDKGQTDDTTVENQGLLDLELKPKKEADIPVSKGGNATGSQTVILDVNEFAIDIIDGNGNTVKHYDSYADLKSCLEMGVWLWYKPSNKRYSLSLVFRKKLCTRMLTIVRVTQVV